VRAQCANIVGICIVLQGRPALVMTNVGGDSAAMAQVLANMSAGVGILEFLLNATVGRLSDAFGRRLFLFASPVVNLVLKAGVFATQSPFMLAAERVVNGAITTIAGSTMCSTMLSDLYSGPDLAKAYAMVRVPSPSGRNRRFIDVLPVVAAVCSWVRLLELGLSSAPSSAVVSWRLGSVPKRPSGLQRYLQACSC
jgi:MFS family permease